MLEAETKKGGCCADRNAQLVEDGAEPLHLALHLGAALLPEVVFVGLLEADGDGLLQRADAAVADARVRRRHVADQVLRSDQPADAPAGGVEVLAARPDGQGALRDLRGEGADPGERRVVQPVVDLVREDDQVVLDRQRADARELRVRVDLADRVVAGEGGLVG